MAGSNEHASLIAVLDQKIKDLERRVTSSENTARILMLLVLTTVIGAVLNMAGIGS